MSSYGLSVGIIGLPNVGKSTLFNALLKKQAALAANYPFATIEPNIGVVPVPDERLIRLAEITKSEHSMSDLPPIKPAIVEFVDIAGLVKGASVGAGLGNKFLSHIREVAIIANVVRAFDDSNIVKEGAVDPLTDYQTIKTELMLADLQTIQNSKKSKDAKLVAILDSIDSKLNQGIPVREVKLGDEEKQIVEQLFLLSAKPEIIVLNVPEADYTKDKITNIVQKYAGELDLDSSKFVVICAKIEEELAALSEDEQREFLADLGLERSGLERLIKQAYGELGLISFLTCGEKEVRAWTLRRGSTALRAAGEIHTDFVKNFIKAEVVSFDDFVENKGWKGSLAKGVAKLEGKDYVVQDGDIIEFKIGR